MEFHLRIFLALIAPIVWLINALFNLLRTRQAPTYPPIRNPLLTKPLHELVIELRRKRLSSTELVTAYIARIKAVNAALNAVTDARYECALKEARHADALIAQTHNDYERVALYARYPLLGVPFTVKEACGVKGLAFNVGSIVRQGVKCEQHGATVALLCAAGGIPLAVSACPEFCMSFETNSPTLGKCRNPYDLQRTTAGSSGGEAALNGSGATLFGVGSDISGSIRLPALFCGVFGHKPTGGLTSIQGHFPCSKADARFPVYLQCGPITRFARDLPLLLEIMAGENKSKLNMAVAQPLKDIKIFYSFGFKGLRALVQPPIDFDNTLAIKRALKCFAQADMVIEEFDIALLQDSLELSLACFASLRGVPSVITQHPEQGPSLKLLILEILNGLIGHSLFSTDVLCIELMKRLNGLMTQRRIEYYQQAAESLKETLTQLLGTNGVLFLPTFHTSALFFNTALLNITGAHYLALSNILGFPSTHVPMGLNARGLPIGFQVIAAPYQDKLCLQIAAELEGAFGGWLPPIKHEIQT